VDELGSSVTAALGGGFFFTVAPPIFMGCLFQDSAPTLFPSWHRPHKSAKAVSEPTPHSHPIGFLSRKFAFSRIAG